MNQKHRILFMGTPDFAVLSLRALVRAGYTLAGVVTQPDRPSGRGQKPGLSPVKKEALALGLEVYQPVKIKEAEFLNTLTALQPDLIVTAAYGRILPPAVLELPPFGCVNVHASLLPQYRGAAPIHRAVLNGEAVSGVTTMLMNEGLDTGDILLKEPVEITPEMTSGELHDILAQKGADLLIKTLELWFARKLEPTPQDDAQSSYAAPLARKDERIDWDRTNRQIHNQIRGLEPWPGAFTDYRGKPLKIREARLHPLPEQPVQPGTVVEVVKGAGFAVQTGQGGILVTKVQPFGKNVMPADSFMNGYHLTKGFIFENE
ncbi:MAG: methionyl-tRNA formyltransferase [Clostridia bacterium]|jgi:methionyl-tRNA formyltransferase|nr:methionyl-tRNA formyltransferase [Clostridia bacterium]